MSLIRHLVLPTGCLVAAATHANPVIPLVDDNLVVTESCRIVLPRTPIVDADGDGVIRIVGDDLTVEFEGVLRGDTGEAPDQRRGIGVVVTGDSVTIRNLHVRGYRGAIHAVGADFLTIDGADLRDGYRQRLGSTAAAEDAADWLWPHDNDEGEWRARYSAAAYFEDARFLTIRNVVVRDFQNGLILDRVLDSTVVDNDCSFLSGWGLAMWRSSRNRISRNAFDFCVRGYSHGVYNRGQDSAGILMFEQCRRNRIIENSATHGGDGLFAFAGREALGQRNPKENPDDYRGLGHEGNIIVGNDFSYAVAHGLELTFSFDNAIVENRFVGNGICGVWGGYSQGTLITDNTFAGNGDMAYGQERGGINIEHGRNNRIMRNEFRDNRCGVFLWWDNDEALLATPWAQANDPRSRSNWIYDNTWRDNDVDLQLRQTELTFVSEDLLEEDGVSVDRDAVSELRTRRPPREFPPSPNQRAAVGDARPVGARAHLRGREHIIMGEWGPWDHEAPLVRIVETAPHRRVFQLLGVDDTMLVDTMTRGAGAINVTVRDDEQFIELVEHEPGVHPFDLAISANEQELGRFTGVFVNAAWEVTSFAWTTDPREDVEAWRDEATTGVSYALPALALDFGHGGPSEADGVGAAAAAASLPGDRFGTLASASIPLTAGRWRLTTRSDDGIRVWLDGEVVIDDWTWHAPRDHTHEFTIDADRAADIRVEHFELDGYAVLEVGLEPVE